MNTDIKEINYLERYLTTKQKHRNLLFKYESMVTKPVRKETEDIQLMTILEAVCSSTEIIPHDILGRNRQRNISVARHLFCYVAYTHYGYCLTAIGRFLVKDHSTVINSVNKFQGFLDFKYKEEVKYYEQCKNILSIGA